MKTNIENAEDFLATLEAAREADGLSHLKVANESGTGHASYWNWRSGKVMPKLDTALKYAKALGFKVFLQR